MSLKRSTLEAMGLTAQQIDTIIADHTETVTAIQKERDGFKAQAEELAGVKTQLATATTELEKLKTAGADAAKVQADFDAYKKQVEAEKTNGRKDAAVRALFKGKGVSRDTLLELLMGKVDLNKVELDDKGNVKDADTFVKGYQDTYGDCFSTKGEEGTPKTDPPAGGSTDYDAMSDAEYYKATYEARKAAAKT